MSLSSPDSICVLHVDDDLEFAEMTAEFLEHADGSFAVETVTSAADGLDRLAEDEVDCVVSDHDMPGTDGLEFLEAVREQYPDLPFILFTGKGSEEVASEAISGGATDYLQKDTGTDQYTLLANRIRNAVSQYRAVQRRRRSEERYLQLVENAPVPILVYSADARIAYANDAAVEYFNADSRDRLLGRSATDLVHPEHAAQHESRLTRLVEQRESVPAVEQKAVALDGETKHHIVASTPITFDGEPAIQSIAYDVSGRKERERELERYETIVETLGDSVYTLDADGCYTFVNDAFVEETGYDHDEVLGEHVSLTLRDEDIERSRDAIQELLTDDERDTAIVEADRITADGEHIPLEIHIGLLPPDDDGEFRGTAGVARDVTERKERERELEHKNQRLEEFVNIVSHDLRNPLNVAQGRLELAREDCDSEHLDGAANALERNQALIDDLLALAREGGRIRETEPVALADIVGNCWGHVDTAEASLVTDTDCTLRADPGRLKQLMENLIRNAIEHGGGDVAITVGDLPDGAGFYVEDDGPGIPDDERERVFESGYSASAENTGFGLAIVEDIATAHGWEIDVTDGEDGGARFEITGVGSG